MGAADPVKQQAGLLTDVRRSVRYHMHRCRFFDGLSTSISAVNLVAGSGAIVSVLGKLHPAWAVATSAIVAVGSAINAVFGLARRARQHNDLARRFIDLERQIVLAGPATEEGVRTFTAERLRIENDEPAVLRALDALCHNELAKSMGCQKDQMYKIGSVRRALAHFINFDCTNLKTIAEIEAVKEAKKPKRPGQESAPAQ